MTGYEFYTLKQYLSALSSYIGIDYFFFLKIFNLAYYAYWPIYLYIYSFICFSSSYFTTLSKLDSFL